MRALRPCFVVRWNFHRLQISAPADLAPPLSQSRIVGYHAGKETIMAKRELIKTGTDKRFVRRNGAGQFKESDDVGRSLSSDRRRKATAKAKPGQGDKGDRKPAARKATKKKK